MTEINESQPSLGLDPHRGEKLVAYEYPTPAGVVRLLKTDCGWVIEFQGEQLSEWPSPDAAAAAASHQKTRSPEWDQARLAVPDDLLRWRPLGESL